MLNQRGRFTWNLRKRFVWKLQRRTGLRNNRKFNQKKRKGKERQREQEEEEEDEFVQKKLIPYGRSTMQEKDL